VQVSLKGRGWGKQHNQLEDAIMFAIMKKKMYKLKSCCRDYRKHKGREK
jgi:hypothetical protein